MSKMIKRILVSQPKPASEKSPYYQIIEEAKVEINFKPFFKIKPITVRHFRDQKIDILQHTAIVLNSRTMVDHLFELFKELRLEPDASVKYFCSSEMITLYLQKYITVRKRKVFFPEKGSGTPDLLALIKKHGKETFFIPSTEGYKDDLFEQLDAEGIAYTKGILSSVEYTQFDPGEIEGYDMLLFFSPNGVQSLLENLPEYKQGHQQIGCLGEGTRRALEEHGLQVHLAVPNAQFQSITQALEHHLSLQKEGKAEK